MKTCAADFLSASSQQKLVFNISDQHRTPNIGGFNVLGFRPRFFSQFREDAVKDYEQTFIGVFAKSLFHLYASLGFHKSLDLAFSATLF